MDIMVYLIKQHFDNMMGFFQYRERLIGGILNFKYLPIMLPANERHNDETRQNNKIQK